MSPTSLSLPLCVCLSLSPSLCTLSLSTSLCLSLSLSLYPFSLPLCVCLSLSLYVCISLSLTLSLSELSLSTSNLSLSTSLCLSISISRALSTVFKSSLFPANSHMILTLSLPLSFYPLLFCRIPRPLSVFHYMTLSTSLIPPPPPRVSPSSLQSGQTISISDYFYLLLSSFLRFEQKNSLKTSR